MGIESFIDSIVIMNKCKKNIEYLSRINVGQNEDVNIKEIIDKDISNFIEKYSLEFEKITKYTTMYLEEKRSLNLLDHNLRIDKGEYLKNNIPFIEMVDGMLDDIQEVNSNSFSSAVEAINDLKLDAKNNFHAEEYDFIKLVSSRNQISSAIKN